MFWRGVLGYLPVNIAQGVVGLLTIVLFTQILSPAEYGIYALAFSVQVRNAVWVRLSTENASA